MATDDQPAKRKCTACDGDGGRWDTGNGEKFKNRRWITCPACDGTGNAS